MHSEQETGAKTWCWWWWNHFMEWNIL